MDDSQRLEETLFLLKAQFENEEAFIKHSQQEQNELTRLILEVATIAYLCGEEKQLKVSTIIKNYNEVRSLS